MYSCQPCASGDGFSPSDETPHLGRQRAGLCAVPQAHRAVASLVCALVALLALSAAVATVGRESFREASSLEAASDSRLLLTKGAGEDGVLRVTGDAWQVVSKDTLSIRLGKSFHAKVIGTKSTCSIATGQQEGDWLKLSHEPGYVSIVFTGNYKLMKKIKMTYAKTSGNCSDIGMHPIVEPGVCLAAAKALGIETEGFMITHGSPKPYGCYMVLGTGELGLAVNPFNEGNGAMGPRVPICADRPPCHGSTTCLVQTSFGQLYTNMSDTLTTPNKRHYASLHGYRLIVSQQETLQELIEKDFADCFPGVGMVRLDTQTLLKICSVLKAFRTGCGTVFWTDSDAAILAAEVPLAHWLEINKKAHVFWSVSDLGAEHTCFDWPTPNGCRTMGAFVSCLNAGAVIFRSTSWSENFLLRIAARSRFLADPKCSTAKLNKAEFDQCGLKGAPATGDQCAIACETKEDPTLMEHFECLSSRTEPVFQSICGPESKTWIPKLKENSFVANCIGHPKWECVKRVTGISWMLADAYKQKQEKLEKERKEKLEKEHKEKLKKEHHVAHGSRRRHKVSHPSHK
eukprot:CAMPEP_0172726382 /NCGR_PEP_ID=MMETSP1074-20121228/90557_1 /TAXON_ID=2916 /ORGANISM="Ceratium fusus, Strain PA161109" /LENGTH=571 /DNA_ID=CAMNT_0013553379 /DNA_START=23 /DNA_END=1738 /DNA_ORIENTATION=-